MSIEVLRENIVKQLTGLKDDNVSIAGIAIDRRKLLEVLKLQTQPGADMLTINYGEVSWEYEYKNHKDGSWEYKPFTFEPKPCIQISCDHTIMRFMHHPKAPKYGQAIKVIPLNFVDHKSYVKPVLTGIPLDTREFINALTYALHGVATEETRPVLCCVLFDSGNDILKLVSADGFRLPMVSIPAIGIAQDMALVHSKDIKKLLTFLKAIKPIGTGKGKYYPDVYISYTEKAVKFASEQGSIELDKQDGTYPSYGQLIPKDAGSKIEFIASDMHRAIKAIANIAKDGSGIIRLQFQQGDPVGKVVVSAKSEEYGESAVECDAIVEYSEYHNDKPCHIAADSNYLMALLKLCGDSKVTLKTTHESSPMLFEIGDDKQAVIMPMFVQWESLKDFEDDRVLPTQIIKEDKEEKMTQQAEVIKRLAELTGEKKSRKPNNQKRRQILDFARDNNLVIHPGRGFDYYVDNFYAAGHCPCDKDRPDCPCPESINEVKENGRCKCCLFWRDHDTFKESHIKG